MSMSGRSVRALCLQRSAGVGTAVGRDVTGKGVGSWQTVPGWKPQQSSRVIMNEGRRLCVE